MAVHSKNGLIILFMLVTGLVAGGLAAAGSIAGAGLSSALGMYNSKKSAKKQYQYYIQSLLNGPSAQVQGLRKAGLNPLLATGLGATDASIPVSPVHPDVGNPVSSGLDGAINAMALKEAKANAQAAESNSALTQLKNAIQGAEMKPILDLFKDKGHTITVEHGEQKKTFNSKSLQDLIQSAYRAKLQSDAAESKTDAETSTAVNNFIDGVGSSAKEARSYFNDAKRWTDRKLEDIFFDAIEAVKSWR